LEEPVDPVPLDSADSARLLERIGQGDRQAFDELFARHRPALLRAIELRLGPELRARLDASDVIQEAQLEAFRRLADYLERRPMPFALWLRKTAQERLLMMWRRHVGAARRDVGREVALPDHSSLQLAGLLAGGPTPSGQAEREELAGRVRRALARLAEADREVLLLHTFEGLSYDEIGALLEINAAAARQRHGRALLRLHRALVDDGLKESPL
jgi:RNA polymerase sigma-70 factor (ECF subfamily)